MPDWRPTGASDAVVAGATTTRNFRSGPLARAREIIARHEVNELSARDRDRFLETPASPTSTAGGDTLTVIP